MSVGWKRIEDIWASRWLGYCLVAIALATCVWWYFHIPAPGYSVTFMAVAAGLMALRPDIRGREKWLWAVTLFAFAGTEIRAIRHDREDSNERQKAFIEDQRKHFKDIGDGVETVIGRSDEGFKETTRQASAQFDATMNKAQENINQLTGGNSYLYFVVSEPLGPMEIDPHKGLMITNAFPAFVGNHPLHNVYVATFCTTTRWLPDIDYGTMFPNETGRPRQILELLFRPEGDRQRCNILINTSNGSYSQEVLFLRQGTKWVQATRFFKGTSKKPSRVSKSEGFPTNWHASDWYQ